MHRGRSASTRGGCLALRPPRRRCLAGPGLHRHVDRSRRLRHPGRTTQGKVMSFQKPAVAGNRAGSVCAPSSGLHIVSSSTTILAIPLPPSQGELSNPSPCLCFLLFLVYFIIITIYYYYSFASLLINFSFSCNLGLGFHGVAR